MQRVLGLLVASTMSFLGGGPALAESLTAQRANAPKVHSPVAGPAVIEEHGPAGALAGSFSTSSALDPNAGDSSILDGSSSTSSALDPNAGNSSTQHASPANVNPNSAAPPAAEAPRSVQQAHCYLQFLERYTQQRNFTLRLIEDRTHQRFDFTEDQRLQRPRTELTPEQRKEFERQVERYTRLHEFTLRLQEQQELREALAFARELALQEKKRAFTQQLQQSRRSDPSQGLAPAREAVAPVSTAPGAPATTLATPATATTPGAVPTNATLPSVSATRTQVAPAATELPRKPGSAAPSQGLVTR